MLRELALAHLDLAAAADAAPAADGVDVDAEPAGRVEDGGAGLEAPAPAGWGEDDEVVRHVLHLSRAEVQPYPLLRRTCG